MTYTDIQKQLIDLSGSISYLKRIVEKLEYRSQVNKTIKELEGLTDRELNDIGISRCMIRSVAEGTHRD